jgi:hypothetical protein
VTPAAMLGLSAIDGPDAPSGLPVSQPVQKMGGGDLSPIVSSSSSPASGRVNAEMPSLLVTVWLDSNSVGRESGM